MLDQRGLGSNGGSDHRGHEPTGAATDEHEVIALPPSAHQAKTLTRWRARPGRHERTGRRQARSSTSCQKATWFRILRIHGHGWR